MTNKYGIFPRKVKTFGAYIASGIVAVSSIVPAQVSANGFLLAPTRVFFDGPSRSQEVTIMNQTNTPQTYRLRLEDRRLKENGEYDVITDPADPSGAAAMLRLSVRQIVVPAMSSGTVRVLLRKPGNLASGEIRSHLIFTEMPTAGTPETSLEPQAGISVQLKTVFGISIPIIVRTGEVSARVTKVQAKRVAVEERPDLENVDVRIETSGNRSMFVDLRVVPARQRRSDPIVGARSVPVYFPLTAKEIRLSLTPEQAVKLRAGPAVLQYQEVDKDGQPVGPVSEVAL